MNILNGKQRPESLCYTCSNAHIVRGFAESEEQVWCTYGWHSPMRPVPFLVRTCTDYNDVQRASLYDMEEMALILMDGSRGKKVGFSHSPGFIQPGEETEPEEPGSEEESPEPAE